MKLLVFGQTGQVAQELQRLEPDALYLGRERANLDDPEACAEVIRAVRPEAVINAAAWTAVDRAEEQEAEAYRVNALAPAAMAEACAASGAVFLHLSTDYVFDGSGETPRKPDARTAPLGAYGRTKLAGEEGVRAAGGRSIILRTSWVFSAHGSNFVKTMLRLGSERPSLRVVADQIGGPTPAADIAGCARALVRAMADGAPGGTYHYAGAPETSWAGFAREIFRLADLATLVEDIPTDAYPTPARRPLNSRLDCAALAADFGIMQPDWRVGLARVIDELRGRGA